MPREEPAETFRVIQVFLLVLLEEGLIFSEADWLTCLRQTRESKRTQTGQKKEWAPMTMEGEKAMCLNKVEERDENKTHGSHRITGL